MQVDSDIQVAYESGTDFSSEATAERIVSFSTQFLGAYQMQHPELDKQQALTSYIEVISAGIEQGFSEAIGVLEGLNVLEGDIEGNIDKTYQLVQDGIQGFIDKISIPEEAEQSTSL